MNSDSKSIKYRVIDQDVEMLISPKKMNMEKDSKAYKYLITSVVIVAFLVVLSALFIYSFYYMCEHDGLHIDSNTGSCVALEPVDRVVVEIVTGHNLRCHDNISCSALLQTIEQLHNGSSYNFVIGSGKELYVGLGFKCRVDPRVNDLHIRMLWSNHSSEGETNRLLNIIHEGLKCGHIMPNLTVSYLCHGIEKDCASAVQYMNEAEYFLPSVEGYEEVPVIGHTVHRPVAETGVILQNTFRWTPCGEATHEARNITKSKVITLESLPRESCIPFSPVDQINVYSLEDETNLTCNNTTCHDIIGYIESQLNGFNYNFVILPNGELYIGLGFRCLSNQTERPSLNVLIISLNLLDISYGLVRFAELVKQGVNCGKISENYTVSAYYFTGNDFVRNHPLDTLLFNIFTVQKQVEFSVSYRRDFFVFDSHINTEVRFLPFSYKLVLCANHLPAGNITAVKSTLESTTENILLTTTISHESRGGGSDTSNGSSSRTDTKVVYPVIDHLNYEIEDPYYYDSY